MGPNRCGVTRHSSMNKNKNRKSLPIMINSKWCEASGFILSRCIDVPWFVSCTSSFLKDGPSVSWFGAVSFDSPLSGENLFIVLRSLSFSCECVRLMLKDNKVKITKQRTKIYWNDCFLCFALNQYFVFLLLFTFWPLFLIEFDPFQSIVLLLLAHMSHIIWSN